ncbi:MAG: deaminase, partial [Pseudomonadota bacterium]
MTTAASLSFSPAPPAAGERELAFMRQALGAAEQAAGRGEVPVGAVVAIGDQVIAVAHNERETGA